MSDYTPSGNPSTSASGSSSDIRTEFGLIQTAIASKANATNAVLVTPALGTPSSGVLTSCTGLPISTGVSGLGTGIATALAVNVGSAGAPVTFNGAGGTPSSMVGTNITGTAAGLTAGVASAVAVGGITGLGAGVGTFLATASSANLAAAVTDETGSGALVFGTSPTINGATIFSPVLMTPQASTSGTSIDFTGIPAGVKKITVTFAGVSTNGTGQLRIQIGTAAGLETSGYVSGAYGIAGSGGATSTSGLILDYGARTAGLVTTGKYELVLANSTAYTWVASGTLASGLTSGSSAAGSKSAAGVVDRISVVTDGVDAFDAGEINVMYE